MTERSTQPNIALVSLFAGLVGAILALLTAPRSGAETRDILLSNAKDMKKQAQQELSDAKVQMDQAIGQAKSVSTKVSGKLTRQGKTLRQNLKDGERDAQLKPDQIQAPVLSNWEKEI